jgi:hypothetical protein
MLHHRILCPRIAAGLVTLTAVLAACASATAAPPVRLVNRPVAAAAVSKTPLTVYGGLTSQDTPFALQIARDHKHLVRLLVFASARCPDGAVVSESGPARFTGALPTLIQANTIIGNALPRSGKFHYDGLASEDYGTFTGGLQETITGRVTGSRARGTYRMTVDLRAKDGSSQQTCTTGTLTWKTESAPGRVFAGLTAAQRPVVIRASADRRRVTDALIGWGAPCDPSGAFIYGEHFTGFPVASTGRFGDAFDQTPTPAADGSHGTFHYELAGSLGHAKARGTFAATARFTAADGTTTATCTQATESWSATS